MPLPLARLLAQVRARTSALGEPIQRSSIFGASSQSCGATPWDDTPCKRVYAANVGPGEPCQSDMQCVWPQNGRAERDWPAEGDQYCLLIQFVGQGAACDALDAGIIDGGG
jgi:hypothetical protein